LSKARARLVDRLRSPRLRPREGQFIVEGLRGAKEFLLGSLSPDVRVALASPRLKESEKGRELVELLSASGVPVEDVSDQELGGLSDTQQSQGILLVVREPEGALALVEGSPEPRILLLDGIQDPGNAGTLVRAARAFGLNGVFALDGTVDLFNPKVVRASAGALAYIPVSRMLWGEAANWLAAREVPLLIADAKGDDVRSLDSPRSWAVVVGNEGAGPRDQLTGQALKRVAIPMASGVDSLNAAMAGAILLFALTPTPGNQTEN